MTASPDGRAGLKPPVPNRPVLRVWVVAILTCLCAAGAQWGRAGYMEVREPARSLQNLPREIGTWMGADQNLESGTTAVLNATSHLNRRYTDPAGNSIALHAAMWTSPDEVCSAVPHHPEQCYRAAGWHVLEQTRWRIPTASGELPIHVCLIENQGRRIVSAHWYQMGEYRYTSQGEALSVLPHFWGRREWPAVVKVMLQTPGSEIAAARTQLERFAEPVFVWTAEMSTAGNAAADGSRSRGRTSGQSH